MEEDLAVLFGEDDDFENDSKGVDEEEAWEVNEEWLMAPVTPTSGDNGAATECAGLIDRRATERHVDPVVADYSYRDRQRGEHTDAVHFGIRETDYNIEEKITRTLAVLVALHFDF
nr:hypothetical protein [Tanacetum cinerariifolium]